jgi:hypothetical protein
MLYSLVPAAKMENTFNLILVLIYCEYNTSPHYYSNPADLWCTGTRSHHTESRADTALVPRRTLAGTLHTEPDFGLIPSHFPGPISSARILIREIILCSTYIVRMNLNVYNLYKHITHL